MTCLFSWPVHHGSAACRVMYIALPEVGCYFVKMRNKRLPRAAGEEPPFLKWYYPTCLSFRGLVDGRAPLWYTLSPFARKLPKLLSGCPLLWRSPHSGTWLVSVLRSVPNGPEPPSPEAQVSLSLAEHKAGCPSVSPLEIRDGSRSLLVYGVQMVGEGDLR